jgi:hypothetical protein
MVWLLSFVATQACAPRVIDVAPRAATLPSTELFEIPAGRCTPELDGVYLSWPAARQLLRNTASANVGCAKALALVEAERDVEVAKALAADKRAAQNDWLARWGLPIGVVVGVLAGAGATWAILGVVR